MLKFKGSKSLPSDNNELLVMVSEGRRRRPQSNHLIGVQQLWPNEWPCPFRGRSLFAAFACPGLDPGSRFARVRLRFAPLKMTMHERSDACTKRTCGDTYVAGQPVPNAVSNACAPCGGALNTYSKGELQGGDVHRITPWAKLGRQRAVEQVAMMQTTGNHLTLNRYQKSKQVLRLCAYSVRRFC